MFIASTIYRFLRRSDGTSAIEFALLAPVFFAMVFTLIQLGWCYFNAASVQWALDRATRIAAIDPDVTQGDLQTFISSELAGLTNKQVSLSYSVDTSGTLPILELGTVYTHSMHIPFVDDYTLSFNLNTSTPLFQP